MIVSTRLAGHFFKNRKFTLSGPPLQADAGGSYLTVDYERSTFGVSQALWQENASQNLTAILSINASTPRVSTSTPTPHKLSSGAVIGIAIGAGALCLIVLGAIIFYFWKRRKSGKEISDSDGTGDAVEVGDTSMSKPMELQGDAKGPGELTGDGEYFAPEKKLGGAEMEGSPAPTDRVEVQGTQGGVEMEGSRGGAEMEGSPLPEMDGRGHDEIFELPANEFLNPRPPRVASPRNRERVNSNPRFSWRRKREEEL